MRTIQLTASDFSLLNQPVRGAGGFQNLLRRIKAGYDPGTGTLQISALDEEQVIRYSGDYGGGGFQGRLGPLVAALIRPSGR